MVKSTSISCDYQNFRADLSTLWHHSSKKTSLVHCVYGDFCDLIWEESLQANDYQSSCWTEKYERKIQVTTCRDVEESFNSKI